eukprot:CAMPEP_0119277130 /NCGR_PEP_ID=MMETSP1329-20130426/16632_1 /TAXON_ID=114041 /ORGANISM="Genus nov. species nov., Strain RCC1024" /LENGTH=244 /DNA_ID=CAMNT_0007277589 /DNA_START=225 /DNA_END=956 /DNA_ORIENTATION=-
MAPPADVATAEHVAELRAAVAAEVDPTDAAFPVDDACLRRYLRARDGDVKKAAKMLKATLKWRKEYGTATIVEDKFPVLEAECATGKTYVAPFRDRAGRATVVMRNRNENTKDHDGNVAHLVYQMERAVAAAKETPQETWNLVIDFEGYSLRNAPPMKTSRATLSVMQDHYPERLNKAFLIQAPWIFMGFFRLISPFIDPVTRDKIVFVSGKPAERAKVMAEHFEMGPVEDAFGGGSKCAYDAA